MALSEIEQRLVRLGFTLPSPSVPKFSYVPYRVTQGGHVYVAGQVPRIPREDGSFDLRKGTLGADMGVEEAQEAARMCALNIMAQLNAATGHDLTKVRQFLKLEGFVRCTPDFTDVSKVIDGASELLVEVFGKDVGVHSRTAVGVSSLPLGVPVEISAVVELDGICEPSADM